MTSATCHLTDEELDDLLMGVAEPELQTHCAACVLCSSRIATVSDSIQCYNRASMAWSEARSHTFTRDLSAHRTTWRLTASAGRSLAATLILGVVASLTTGTYLFSGHTVEAGLDTETLPAARAFAPEGRAQQIARDNAMLQAIDAELTEPASAPAGLFHAASTAARTTAAESASAQDRD